MPLVWGSLPGKVVVESLAPIHSTTEGKAMAAEWTMIRVRQETADWLRTEALHIAGLAVRGMVEQEITDRVGNQQGCGVSVDAVIRRLIEQVTNHRRRTRKARGNRAVRINEHSPGFLAGAVGEDAKPAETVL